MRVSTTRLRRKLEKYNVPVKYVPNWNSASINPYSVNDMQGILLHHTAGTNSLRWIAYSNPYAPVRACHFLVNHDGSVSVVSGSGAYHAGRGGPWKITNTVTIPKDSGNSRTYGIEIESLGTSSKIDGSKTGMSIEQVTSTALLCVALLDAMRPGPGVYRVGRIIRHRDWAPNRKPDVRQDLQWWRDVINIARKYRKNTARAKRLIRAYVEEHPKGKA